MNLASNSPQPTHFPIFIDTNIPIYAAGKPHPLKDPCARMLLLPARQPHKFFTSAEVLQELLHYYLSRGRWLEGRDVLRRFDTLMHGRVDPVLASDVTLAASLASTYATLDARDLLHVAVMQRVGADRIISADQRFDDIPFVQRLSPESFDSWRVAIEPA